MDDLHWTTAAANHGIRLSTEHMESGTGVTKVWRARKNGVTVFNIDPYEAIAECLEASKRFQWLRRLGGRIRKLINPRKVR